MFILFLFYFSTLLDNEKNRRLGECMLHKYESIRYTSHSKNKHTWEAVIIKATAMKNPYTFPSVLFCRCYHNLLYSKWSICFRFQRYPSEIRVNSVSSHSLYKYECKIIEEYKKYNQYAASYVLVIFSLFHFLHIYYLA